MSGQAKQEDDFWSFGWLGSIDEMGEWFTCFREKPDVRQSIFE
jgi:hypothetical protein